MQSIEVVEEDMADECQSGGIAAVAECVLEERVAGEESWAKGRDFFVDGDWSCLPLWAGGEGCPGQDCPSCQDSSQHFMSASSGNDAAMHEADMLVAL